MTGKLAFKVIINVMAFSHQVVGTYDRNVAADDDDYKIYGVLKVLLYALMTNVTCPVVKRSSYIYI